MANVKSYEEVSDYHLMNVKTISIVCEVRTFAKKHHGNVAAVRKFYLAKTVMVTTNEVLEPHL
jgi:SepF-like predicted cell division protein (DUF552 family)